MRIRICDDAGVLFYVAREPEAEQLLKAGLAKPLGRGSKIRCLSLTCSRRQAWTFLRGAWPCSPSKTTRIERVGDKKLPVYAYLDRSFGFGTTEHLPIVSRPAVDGLLFTAKKSPPEDGIDDFDSIAEKGVSTIDTHESSVVQHDRDKPDLANSARGRNFIPNERGLNDAAKEPERVPVEPETLDVVVVEEPGHDITPGGDDRSPKNGWRMLALEVLAHAIREDRGWFERDNCKGIMRFWCELAGLDVRWVCERVAKPSQACPGLQLHGRTWFLNICRHGEKKVIRLGHVERDEAVRVGLAKRKEFEQAASAPE